MRIVGLAFVVALTGAMSPGPLLALVIGQVLAQGPAAVLFLLLGHAFLEALLVIGLAKGLLRWLQSLTARVLLGVIGGGVLLWMGWTITASASAASLVGTRGQEMPWFILFLAGIGASLSNPYFTGWWATVGTGQVATLDLRSRRDFTQFFIGHELGDFSWYLLVAVVLTTGRAWLTDEIYSQILWIAGGVVILLGTWFVWVGLRHLFRRSATEAHSPSAAER